LHRTPEGNKDLINRSMAAAKKKKKRLRESHHQIQSHQPLSHTHIYVHICMHIIIDADVAPFGSPFSSAIKMGGVVHWNVLFNARLFRAVVFRAVVHNNDGKEFHFYVAISCVDIFVEIALDNPYTPTSPSCT
jgi:hypothetical protein